MPNFIVANPKFKNMNTAPILKSENAQFSQATIGGIQCSVAYIKKFKWSWLATQLNAFVIIGETDALIDKNAMAKFSSDCFDYALKHSQGWPRGIQSGIGSVAILKGNNVDQSAVQFVENFSKKHFSAFEIPVVYDTEKKRAFRYVSTPLWGKIYFPFFTKVIDGVSSSLN